MTNTTAPATYVENLLAELDDIHAAYAHVLANSSIVSAESCLVIPEWAWAPSDVTVEAERMMLLGRIRDWVPRFRLLFPHPTPAISQRLDEHLSRLEAWLIRESGAYDVPATPAAAVEMINADVADLRALTQPMTPEDYPTRLVTDTNALIDNPDLAAYTDELGRKYIVHLLPVVLGEIDDLKRAGKTQDLRDAALRADRRLKGLRTNGNVRTGVRVSGCPGKFMRSSNTSNRRATTFRPGLT
jgi:hypothetical protein